MFPELVTIGETMVVLVAAEGHSRYVPRFNKKQEGTESNVANGVGLLGHSGFIGKN
ncbi:hypothetical protein [Sporosarcina highlanderae]|uniref:Uncharacterized protein n=1 Tax=Sporosarcina highlanderae TaxID=3035916 RepID=A0ABT8JLG0_9BACL|nr:hypothetical protein [Sporosarcina highlanderae]MDN4605914.1 hypothetical protein [Sporosarcina highlanderae]